MKVGSYLLLFLFMVFIPHKSQAQNYGLEFASFNFQKDLRTGLNLNPQKAFPLKQDLEVQFSLNLHSRNQIFGYILRAIVNDTLNLDIQTNYNQNQQGIISVIIGQEIYNFPSWTIDTKIYDGWEEFKVKFRSSEHTLIFSRGLSEHKVSFQLPQKASVALHFGAINAGRFITTDVSPMRLKDIRLFQQDKLIAHWPLNEQYGDKPKDAVHRLIGEVSNPHWIEPRYSQWKLTKRISFQGQAIAAFNNRSEEIYFLKSDSLIIYSVNGRYLRGFAFKGGMQLVNPDSRILFDGNNNLFHYYLDTHDFICFDILSCKWERRLDSNSGSKRDYTQHNGFYSSSDSSIYCFGGYGFYKYKDSLFRYHIPTKTLSAIHLSGDVLNPRYLSAVSMSNSRVFILGGYGSTTGDQRINPQSFKDLYEIFPGTRKSKKLTSLSQLPDDYCFARSFYMFPEENSFYALAFTKHKYLSRLKLIKGNVQTGELTFLGDSIPFLFEDIRSSADMFLSQKGNELICLTSISSERFDSTQFELYSIQFPPNLATPMLMSHTKHPWVIAGFVVIILSGVALMFFLVRVYQSRRKLSLVQSSKEVLAESRDIVNEYETVHTRNSIFFLGELQIFDRDGVEISKLFSPLLKELFLLIFFYSQNDRQGISTDMLNQILWFDKDLSQARNNRSVNMSKLRLNTSRIEGINLLKKNGHWQMEFQTDIVKSDYLEITRYFGKDTIPLGKLNGFLSLVKRGPLLEGLGFEWLDKVKSEFTNKVLDLLLEFARVYTKDNDLTIKIADSIFVHDPLNEVAVKMKYNALIALGRHHMAKSLMEQFKSEYLSLYGEPFSES